MPQEGPTSCCTGFAGSQTKSPSLKLHFFYPFICSTLAYLFEHTLAPGTILDTGNILGNKIKFSDSVELQKLQQTENRNKRSKMEVGIS